MNQFLVLLTFLSCLAVAENSSTYVDTNNASIEEVAQVVCTTTKGTKNLLSRFSTIVRLADFLAGLTSIHPLHECRSQHLEAIEELVHLVKTASQDVCGEQKLALIEDFHRKYVSKVSKHLKEQKLTGKAPKMIKLFFIQYATEVSSTCEQSAIKVLADYKHAISAEEVHKVDELRKFTDTLGMTDLKRGYKRIYLFWNLIESLALAEDEKFSQYLSESGDVRLSVQMKDARQIVALQTVCRRQLQPFYSKSILPVLRLVDMGYYPQSRQLLDDFTNQPNTRSAFFFTQICETILPVAIYSDEKLANDEFVAITKDEASKLTITMLENDVKLGERSVNVEPISLEADEDLVLHATNLKAIKLNVASRSKILNRMMKHMMKQLATKLRTLFHKGFKLLKRNQNQQLEAVDVDVAQLEQHTNDFQIEEELEDGSLSRRKRSGFWKGLWKVIKIASLIIYLIVLTSIKTVIFFIPGVLCAINAILGNKACEECIVWMWYAGVPDFSEKPKKEE